MEQLSYERVGPLSFIPFSACHTYSLLRCFFSLLSSLSFAVFCLSIQVWLLHDLDHTHKWRCCFAWAERPGEDDEKQQQQAAASTGSGMDFSTWKGPDLLGTSQLEGEVYCCCPSCRCCCNSASCLESHALMLWHSSVWEKEA